MGEHFPSDTDLDLAVQNAIRNLNRAILTAANAGLMVDVETLFSRRLQSPTSVPSMAARLYRPI